MKPRIVALIPARSGSKRIPHKNIRRLRGHPLLAYTVHAAVESGVFDAVICATDSDEYAAVARHYGAEVPALRPVGISGDTSPDIEWVVWALHMLGEEGREFEAFSILRPTSPFRMPETIKRALDAFLTRPGTDSLRAVEKCAQHPGKMWVIQGEKLLPLMPFSKNGVPWHSHQYAALPEVFVQNASLEMAWSRVALERHSISGESLVPFVSQGLEGFDLNQDEDWLLAEAYLEAGTARLPNISQTPYPIKE
jgi:N-acylneuraminate cytidylyltransferase